jgi:Mg-chelatase subunit ChlD
VKQIGAGKVWMSSTRTLTVVAPLLLSLVGCAGGKGGTTPVDASADSGAGADAHTTGSIDDGGADSAAAATVDAVPVSDAPALEVASIDGAAPIDSATPPVDALTGTADAPTTPADATPSADAADASTGERLPLDLYVMFDQSGSMARKDDGINTRMAVVRDALSQFLRAPESSGLGIGIGFFGYHPLACECTSCNPGDYATPAVPVGVLPAHAEQIVSALAQVEPVGETPTGAAIRGACRYAGTRRQLAPARKVAILLVTDGEPAAPLSAAKGICAPTLGDAVLAAQECLSTGVRTYVLGVGPSLENLAQIATAGGSPRAYLVSTGAKHAILDMLAAIRADATL